jgi:hypothetical protein
MFVAYLGDRLLSAKGPVSTNSSAARATDGTFVISETRSETPVRHPYSPRSRLNAECYRSSLRPESWLRYSILQICSFPCGKNHSSYGRGKYFVESCIWPLKVICTCDHMEPKIHLPVKGYISPQVTQTVNSAIRKPTAPA